MADLVDVSKTLTAMITPVIYPNGTSQPSILGVGKDVVIMDGFPLKHVLDTTLKLGNSAVSVFPVTLAERNVTRFPKIWQTVSTALPTIIFTVTGNVISLSGTPAINQVCYIKCNYLSYFYPVTVNDTLETIAFNIAALIPGAFINGDGNIEIPAAFSLKTDVSVKTISAKETKRQQKVFTISIWTNSYLNRQILGSAIDTYLSDFVRIVLPDGWYARLIYDHTADIDSEQEHNLYKREINYIVEYATTISQTSNTLTDFEINVNEE